VQWAKEQQHTGKHAVEEERREGEANEPMYNFVVFFLAFSGSEVMNTFKTL